MVSKFFELNYDEYRYLINVNQIHHIEIENDCRAEKVATVYLIGYIGVESSTHFNYANDTVGVGNDTVINDSCVFPIYDEEVLSKLEGVING